MSFLSIVSTICENYLAYQVLKFPYNYLYKAEICTVLPLQWLPFVQQVMINRAWPTLRMFYSSILKNLSFVLQTIIIRSLFSLYIFKPKIKPKMKNGNSTSINNPSDFSSPIAGSSSQRKWCSVTFKNECIICSEMSRDESDVKGQTCCPKQVRLFLIKLIDCN